MEEILMIKQLMTQLSNMMKDKVMITQLVDLSKQKALDADSKAIQQIIFTRQVHDDALTVLYILEKSKETILQFSKGTTKVL